MHHLHSVQQCIEGILQNLQYFIYICVQHFICSPANKRLVQSITATFFLLKSLGFSLISVNRLETSENYNSELLKIRQQLTLS